MKLIYRILLLIAVLLIGTGQLAAQKREPLDRDRLAKDIANAGFLAKIPEIGVDSLTAIRAALGPPYSVSESDIDQTALQFRSEQPGGYTRIELWVLAFGDKILRYRVKVSGRSDSWWMIRAQMIDAWERNTKLVGTERDASILYEREFPDVATAYQAYQLAEFGEFKDLPVPAELANAYALLSSPTKEVLVGDSCGYGAQPPEGKKAIDSLVNANRWDLVENLLSGPNLGGRVYAALALLRRERAGTTLSERIKTRINKFRGSQVIIPTCGGCFIDCRSIAQIIADDGKDERESGSPVLLIRR